MMVMYEGIFVVHNLFLCRVKRLLRPPMWPYYLDFVLLLDAAYILRRLAGVFDAKASVRAQRASVFGDAGLGPPRKPIWSLLF